MTTEKHDPWALLAEIHELQPWLSQDADLAARVEAALAGRAEGSTEDVVESGVEWKRCLAVDESTFLAAALSDKLKVFVYPEEATAGAYPWRATRIETQEGTAPTEAEAKSAAIAAARGMR
jgi:hypothetical protein